MKDTVKCLDMEMLRDLVKAFINDHGDKYKFFNGPCFYCKAEAGKKAIIMLNWPGVHPSKSEYFKDISQVLKELEAAVNAYPKGMSPYVYMETHSGKLIETHDISIDEVHNMVVLV